MTFVAKPAKTNARWKAVALPAEHGGWSFLFEPIALGLLLAPSFAGLCLATAAIGEQLACAPAGGPPGGGPPPQGPGG